MLRSLQSKAIAPVKCLEHLGTQPVQPGPCPPFLCKSTSTTGTGTLRAAYSFQHPKTLDQPLVNTAEGSKEEIVFSKRLLNSGASPGKAGVEKMERGF